MKRMKLLFTLAVPVLLSQNALAQSSSRLIAQANWYSDGAIFKQSDSSDFIYLSDARGGDLSHTQKFDHSTNWMYVGDTAYQNNMYTVQDFDANGNISMITRQSWNGTAWMLYSRTLYTYNSANMITTKIEQTWGGATWIPVKKNSYTYDGSNLMILDLYQVWNSLTNSFDPNSQITYTYDAVTHKVLSEIYQNITPGPTPVYTYTDQYSYTYSSTAQLLTVTHSTWMSGWVNSTLTTNAYDTSGNMITTTEQTWDGMATAWVNLTLDIFSSFTASHMPMNMVHQIWDPTGTGMWVNNMQYTYTYNSHDQMTMSVGQSWNIVGLFEYAYGDPMARYYYGTYGTSAVKTLVSNNGTASVYPVPAKNILNVEVNWENAQAATIALYDISGRMVTTPVTTAKTAESNTAISVNGLAAGIYTVKISAAEGQIVKQIVIAN